MKNRIEGVEGLHVSRRSFLKKGAAATAVPIMVTSPLVRATSIALEGRGGVSLSTPRIGFHSYIKNRHLSHSFEGGRPYNAKLMRFMQIDNMRYSPFGPGGVHGYAFTNGDPINLRDPSGHFAILSAIIGAVIGLVVGAAISAVAESVRVAVTGDKFDWKQVAIGAAVGFVSGGIGSASAGASVGVKSIVAVADSIVSGATEFGLSVASGYDVKESGVSAGIGAAIGLVTFGVGVGVKSAKNSLSPLSRSSTVRRSAEYIPMSIFSVENPRAGVAPTNVASRTNSISSRASISSNSSIASSASSNSPLLLDGMIDIHLLRDHLVPFLDDQSLGNLSSLDRNMNAKLEASMKQRMFRKYSANKRELAAIQQSYRSKLGGNTSASLDDITDLIRRKYNLATKQRMLIQSWIRQFPSDQSVSYTDGVFNIIG